VYIQSKQYREWIIWLWFQIHVFFLLLLLDCHNCFPFWPGLWVASVIYYKYTAVFSYIISSVHYEFIMDKNIEQRVCLFCIANVISGSNFWPNTQQISSNNQIWLQLTSFFFLTQITTSWHAFSIGKRQRRICGENSTLEQRLKTFWWIDYSLA
jgi:hypothetical protein